MSINRLIDNSNFQYLRLAAFIFNQEKIEDGKRVFSLICRDPHHDEWGVYHFIWIVKNSPSGVTEYGRKCFHDLNGLSSTGREKALAIHRHLTARGASTEFVFSPSLETFFIRTGILSNPSIPLPMSIEEEQIDWDLLQTIGGAAATALGILVTAGGVIMMFGSGRGSGELPSLAQHITVGGGHTALRDAVQTIGNNLPSILSSSHSGIVDAERHFHSLPIVLTSSSIQQPIATVQQINLTPLSTQGVTALSTPSRPSVSLTRHVSVGSGHFQQPTSIGNPLIQGRDLVECRAHVAPPIQGWDSVQRTYMKKISEFEKTIKNLNPKDNGRLFYHFECLVKDHFLLYLNTYFNELQEIINNFKRSKYEDFAFKVRVFVENGNRRP